MHKVLLISGLALTLAGCAASQQKAQPQSVRVQDLSTERATATPAKYTVQAGDTLYGIAWRHDMDYRDLARMNRIGPPYRLQPGQTLVLGGEGRPEGEAAGSTGSADSGAVATGLGAAEGAAEGDDESLDWLLPDAPDDASADAGGQAEADAEASAPASAEAGDAAGGSDGPGPVYDRESPGADGTLSEADQAERRAREAAASAETSETGSDGAARSPEAATTQQQAAPAAEASEEADAGASVAGEPEAPASEPRRYTPVDEVPWQWPVEGEVVGTFGEGGSVTAGIDIDGQKGQPVKAAGPGIVVYAGNGVRGYGNLILLKHNDQFLSAYAHNDSLRVKENDVVEAGEVIATMGDSDAEDVRLHFEVRKDGQPQDPLEFLPKR
ncbi:peptidoglycan DD-metalloendopeptidase family protein [Halomonas maura]|uniref:peptidoglycan DD-metalloendopeptidase family protein n=1 Tax=Halomonas maura TaxID=117606 RepID=UPI0025B4D0C4|nr:peptidoglycan DD-metalloendopeptidase family protein [Halomonas maura]MDN3557027.1 peptidoglycan DD-metalloendopeptidase family protein [Halomonas maura]